MNKYLAILSVLILSNSVFAIYGETMSEDIAEGLKRGVIQILKKRGEEYTHSCTGTLVKENIILTAAHCFDDENFTIQIRYKNQVHQVKEIKRDKEYKREELLDPYWQYVYDIKIENDLALIITTSDFELSEVVTLTDDLTQVTKESKIAFSGYGQVSNIFGMGKGEGVYRISDFTFPSKISPFRLHVLDGSTGACLGDSGGPVWLL